MNDATKVPEDTAVEAKTAAEIVAAETKTAKEVLGKLFTERVVTFPDRKPIKIKKVTLRTMRPILALLDSVVEELKLKIDNIQDFNLRDPGVILKLISTHYDEVIDIIVLLTDVEREVLLDMDTDESVVLIQAVIGLNKHFFTTKVLPNLQMLERLQNAGS